MSDSSAREAADIADVPVRKQVETTDENVDIKNTKSQDYESDGKNSDDEDGGDDDAEGGGDDNDMDDDDDDNEDDDDDDEDRDDDEEDDEDDEDEGRDDESIDEEDVVSPSMLGKRSADADDASKLDSPSAHAEESKKNKKRKKKDKTKKTKKRRKTDLGRLFNEMAEEGEDEDDEDWETRETGEVVTTKDELEAIKRQEEGRQRLKEMFFGDTAEEIAKRYDLLSEAQDIEESRFEAMDAYYAQNTQVAQQSLLPSAKDPKIFMIKCTPGKEQNLVMSIMNKTIDVYEKIKIMKVKSAFCGSARGFVFVEALSDTLVREIILGLKGLYMNKIRQLAVSDMTSALKVKILTKPMQVGDFVRVKRGPLKGDLVRILALKEGHTKAEIQAVPRIDYEEEKQSLSGEQQLKVNAGKKVRPGQQLFNAELAFSISDTDIDRDKQSGFYQWRGNTYKDGFLIKTVDVNTYIQSTSVNPTLEELKMFAMGMSQQDNKEEDEPALYRPPVDVNKQLKTLLNTMEGVQAVPYVPGDIVQVLSGEMVGLVGRILDVFELRKVLRIESINPRLAMPIEIEENLVTKYVQVGAHVKVMGGQYTGHTGRVVAMTSSDGDPVAVVLSDGSKTEMYCNVSLLQVSNEVAHGRSTLGGYQKDDLVQLNENEVGMIIDVGLEALRIITQLEIVKDIHPNEIRMNMNQISQRTKFFDAEQKQFGTGDTLKVVSGNHEKSTGIVRHVYKGTVWLHSDNYLKNSGVMVVKARFCLLIGSLHAGRPSTLSAAAPVNSASATGRNSLASTPNSTVSRQSGSAGQPGGRGGGPGGRFAKDPLIGKTVRIMKGPYRGLSAQVINGSGGFYQVELLAKMKKVTVPASTFVEEGDERGRSKPVVPGDSSVRSQSFDSQSFGSMTPYTGMQTPAYIGSETPRVGSETPSHYNVMFTPHRPEDTDSSSWGDAMDLDISNYGTPQHGHGHASIAGTPASGTSAATPASLGVKTSEDVDTWVENMIVMVKAGPEMGRLAVIKRIRHDGTVTLQQRDGMGALINSEFTLPVSSVKPHDKPTAGGIVKILSGNHAGALGTVKMAMKGQVVITVNGSTETFKATSILWLNSVSGK